MTPENLDSWFKYHYPTEEQIPKYEAIRAAGKRFAEVVIANSPESADQTVAVRKIREAVSDANSAISCAGE